MNLEERVSELEREVLILKVILEYTLPRVKLRWFDMNKIKQHINEELEKHTNKPLLDKINDGTFGIPVTINPICYDWEKKDVKETE